MILRFKYKPAVTNQAADALSEYPSFSLMELNSYLSQCSIPWDKLHLQVDSDPFLSSLKKQLKTGSGSSPDACLD